MSEKSKGNSTDQSSDEASYDPTQRLECTKCCKHFKNVRTLKQHLRDHKKHYSCKICDKSFTRLHNLHLHQKNVHSMHHNMEKKLKSFICDTCGNTFNRNYNLIRHKACVHQRTTQRLSRARRLSRAQFCCKHCDSEFERYADLFDHVTQSHPLNQHGGRVASIPRSLPVNEMLNNQPELLSSNDSTKYTEKGTTETDSASNSEEQHRRHPNEETALSHGVANRYLQPRGNEKYDVLTFFGNVRDQVRSFLQSRSSELGGIKWNLCAQVEMQRDDGQELSITSPYFRSQTYVTLSTDDFSEHDLNESMQKMYASLEKFMRDGSGWYVNKVVKLEIHTVVYKPLGGSTYLPLPKTLSKSKSLLNIINQDDKCFLYCLLASLHQILAEPCNVQHYLPYQHEINMTGIVYPVTLSQIRKVENQNENISINVFTYEDNTIVPMRITEKCQRLHHVNLLWLTNDDTSHFCLITDLNSFLSRTNTHRSQLHFCPYCLHGFRKKCSLEEHRQYCSRHGAQKVELPTPGKNDILQFTAYQQTLEVPFVIYCDYETILTPLVSCPPNPNSSSTYPSMKLEVCGFGYKVVSQEERYTKPSVIYRGEDAGRRLIECLLVEEKQIKNILSNIEPMKMDDEQLNLYENATLCCLCKKRFNADEKSRGGVVRHHNHLTGEFIGPACNACNLNCQQVKFVPVIFHNLKSFDAHIICQNLGYFKNHKLTCIAQNTEKYVSFSLGGLRFIDSLQFLPASLETLVEDLAQDGLQAFPHLLSEFQDCADTQLLLRKGVYPYEYFSSFEKFDESELPPKEKFYSSIKKEHISDSDYKHAQMMFKTFDMRTLGDYHDFYLKTDVLLLCDVFQSFRKLCLGQYGLDACHFYTSPGLSWAACLKMTGVQLELLTDIDKILMVESSIRGGFSQVSNRFKKANNPYLCSYDSSHPTTYLQYLDANNLYGWAMVQPLPVGEFAFMEERDISEFDVMRIPELSDTGYILEVSLEYPQKLHDRHNCLPLCPVRQLISTEMLSPYSQHLLRKLHGLSKDDPLPNIGKVEKLLTTLEDKDHYVLHYRNLQLYIDLGMKLKTIHRILKFKQHAWMKPYIEQNTALRQRAISTFQKNFYKLLNVSVFGKTMENVRRHKQIELVHQNSRLRKVTAKPTYKTSTIFNENLVAVELYRNKVNLFKPIYCGMSILDLSKCLMYDFWYNYIKRKYGDSAQLQMTDTDSLLFSCETQDIYRDMADSLDYFDTSDYPRNHFLHSDKNKRVLAKMKDEMNGRAISEFIGLRSKCYSFVCDETEVKRSKGMSKVTVKKDLKHSHYKKVLFDETSMICSMTSLRSHGHELFCENIQKTGLSAFDDKRYLVDPVNSYAYGHYKIVNDTNSAMDNTSELTLPIVSVEDTAANVLTLDEEAFIIGDFTITPCIKNCN